MRIIKVIATDPQTKKKQTFSFGTASQGKEIVTVKGGRLNAYMDFCFSEETENVRDVEVVFDLDGTEYSLSKLHGDDKTRLVLKKNAEGRWQVVARNKNALNYIEQILHDSLQDVLRLAYVNNLSVENFHGDLSQFEEIKMLTEVKEEIEESSLKARRQREDVYSRVRQYASLPAESVTAEQLDKTDEQLSALSQEIAAVTAQLVEMKAGQSVGGIRREIAAKLEEAQKSYRNLTAHKEEIEQARRIVALQDEIAVLVPKVKTLQTLAKQRDEQEKRRYALTTELEWQENELANVNRQLEEKQRQFALTQDKRNRIEAINTELAYIATLYADNKKLNELLLELNDKKQHLTSERVLYVNKLDAVEKALSEVKDSLDAFEVPAKSVGELLETVRVDVKIDEVKSQMEKLQNEITVKESRIAEKESNLVLQMKRFRSIAELDVAVTPIKAKDTILQVLDAKYSKLEAINMSLQEKQRNFERALEDYRYRILQLENSRSKLEGEKNKALLRKQEEFKREVFLNSQKVFNDDASSVFAVNANFHDGEIEALEQEISSRNLDRDQLVELASQLEGAIKEIKRHVEINAAEMDTLRGEKQNINNRYKEIVAQNSSETVFNYLKALNNDNGTKYLLDVQQDAVRSEVELADLKRQTESLRAKVSALKSRLKYLTDTQLQLQGTKDTVDTLVSTNDKVKETLSDISTRLSSGYEQYLSAYRQLEKVNSKLDDINAAIVETQKTVKVNETQIRQSTEKAKKQAGSDDIEQAVANFRYDLGDVESERNMLAESKQAVEKEVFKKRLELEKAQWLYESKSREYDQLYGELQMEFDLKGLDVEKVTSADFEKNISQLRTQIAQYDALKTNLTEKIENYYGILKDSRYSEIPQGEIDQKQQQLDKLVQRSNDLQQLRREQLEKYVSASTAKMKVTAAAAEAKTFAMLEQTLNHNQIVGLLVADKVKSILKGASQYYNAFTQSNASVVEKDGKACLAVDGVSREYDSLTTAEKTALYVSLLLSIPNTDVTDGRWLIFEERINLDRKALSAIGKKAANISFVVDYREEQPAVLQPKATVPEVQTDVSKQNVALSDNDTPNLPTENEALPSQEQDQVDVGAQDDTCEVAQPSERAEQQPVDVPLSEALPQEDTQSQKIEETDAEVMAQGEALHQEVQPDDLTDAANLQKEDTTEQHSNSSETQSETQQQTEQQTVTEGGNK